MTSKDIFFTCPKSQAGEGQEALEIFDIGGDDSDKVLALMVILILKLILLLILILLLKLRRIRYRL